jgi:hypothetical protein
MGDIIDGQDPELGSWFEAKIVSISKKEKTDENENEEKDSSDEDGFLYSIVFKGWALLNILPEFPLIFFIFVLGMKKMIHLL